MRLANASDSISQLVAAGTASTFQLAAQSIHAAAMGPPVCPASTPMSCVNGAPSGNDCCIQNPGFVLQAQIWWINPSIGPSNSWTIHGLWYAGLPLLLPGTSVS